MDPITVLIEKQVTAVFEPHLHLPVVTAQHVMHAVTVLIAEVRGHSTVLLEDSVESIAIERQSRIG